MSDSTFPYLSDLAFIHENRIFQVRILSLGLGPDFWSFQARTINFQAQKTHGKTRQSTPPSWLIFRVTTLPISKHSLSKNAKTDNSNLHGFELHCSRPSSKGVLHCFIDPKVRKIRNEASSCPGIFSRTLYYVASSSGSPLPHLLDGHRKLVGCSAIPARSCSGPDRYHLGSIIELEVPPDETPGLMTLNPHNTNVLQSITYAKSPYPPGRSNPGQKN